MSGDRCATTAHALAATTSTGGLAPTRRAMFNTKFRMANKPPEAEAAEQMCRGNNQAAFFRLRRVRVSGATATVKSCNASAGRSACRSPHRLRRDLPSRKVPRSIHERARDVAREIAKTEAYVRSRRERKKIEMLFADLKRTLRLGRLRLRPAGARDVFLLAATAQNLRKLAKLIPIPVSSPLRHNQAPVRRSHCPIQDR